MSLLERLESSGELGALPVALGHVTEIDREGDGLFVRTAFNELVEARAAAAGARRSARSWSARARSSATVLRARAAPPECSFRKAARS
jgi:hypothetical protein